MRALPIDPKSQSYFFPLVSLILVKTRFIAAYGTNENGAVYNNDDYTNWSFGVKYALNKKSELLAAYNSRSNDSKNTELNTLTIGINAKFGY